jgi:hypothetical protein
MSTPAKVVSLGIGAALAGLSDLAVTRFAAQRRVPLFAVGLVAAAAVYPLFRSSRPRSAPVVRELAALLAFGALGTAVVRGRTSNAARVVAAGWAAHALFDLVHDGGQHSRIPGWYPAFCAGYDLGVAAILLRPTPTAAPGLNSVSPSGS